MASYTKWWKPKHSDVNGFDCLQKQPHGGVQFSANFQKIVGKAYLIECFFNKGAPCRCFPIDFLK